MTEQHHEPCTCSRCSAERLRDLSVMHAAAELLNGSLLLRPLAYVTACMHAGRQLRALVRRLCPHPGAVDLARCECCGAIKGASTHEGTEAE